MTSTSHQSRVEDFRLAVLLSGTGRTLQNLQDWIERSDPGIQIVRVISSRHGARGIEVARRAGIPVSVVPRRDHPSIEGFTHAVFDQIRGGEPNLIACAGFLSKIVVPDDWMGRIINVHPSLLPLFGGRGYYGDRVHRAVLESGMKVSGCSVHFLDNEYDAGPIIAQRCVPVEDDDTVETLASRVFAMECKLYPAVIEEIAAGNVRLSERQVRLTRSVRTDPETS